MDFFLISYRLRPITYSRYLANYRVTAPVDNMRACIFSTLVCYEKYFKSKRFIFYNYIVVNECGDKRIYEGTATIKRIVLLLEDPLPISEIVF